ncbi:hypothetical protein E2562_012793 [Oryza meyeriana var. granulata]|uniref:Copper transport protein n=1 Tax=Oryza meyeriana var. granulata TaxID=110450 RepID=A0A6G1DIF7_9ORYZ|nr:hypothetical protein E2562_012793 [Oryza meyeriana var. granulata]
MAMPMPMPMGPPPGGDMPPAMMPGMATPMGMSFTWGHRAVVLFPGWPGDRSGVGMYLLCLLVVLALAALVEALSAASRGLSSSSRPPHDSSRRQQLLAAGVHAAKMGLAYLVMLAVMSFNGGVLLAAVAGHAAGFLLARSGLLGSRAARETDAAAATSNGSSLHPSSEPKP